MFSYIFVEIYFHIFFVCIFIFIILNYQPQAHTSQSNGDNNSHVKSGFQFSGHLAAAAQSFLLNLS